MNSAVTRIYKQLATARKEQMLSQEQLGSKVGLKQAYVSEIENGRRDSGLSIVQDLARILGFELMLIPRQLVPGVEQLIRSHGPAYREEKSASYYGSLLEELGDNDEQ